MAIDISREQIISLVEAAGQYPGRPHISTIFRWGDRGVCGVRLETVRCGGRRCTSHEALDRFTQRVTAAADGQSIESRSTTPRQRKAEVDQAGRDLDQMNV